MAFQFYPLKEKDIDYSFTVEDVRYVREGNISPIYKSDFCASNN